MDEALLNGMPSVPSRVGLLYLVLPQISSDKNGVSGICTTAPSPSIVLREDWFSKHSDDPEGVRTFCRDHNLVKDVFQTAELTRNFFSSSSIISLKVQYSPELPDGKLVVDVKTQHKVTDAVQRYLSFVDEWTLAVPVRAQERISVTFSAV
jgi:hypothetical protein